MKDLKHLYYFEKLLEDANNELVIQAKSEGKKCVATVCENIPEPLLNIPGAFSVRLRAPRTGSMEMATYYMTSFLCEYTRALLERAIEGGYNFNIGGRDNKQKISFNGVTDTVKFNALDKGNYFVRVGMEFVGSNTILGLFYKYSKGDHIKDNKFKEFVVLNPSWRNVDCSICFNDSNNIINKYLNDITFHLHTY